jgi:hypothetical protein
MNQHSLLRDLVGFLVGGLIGATGAALVYMAILGVSRGAHNGEDRAPLAALTLFMFFAGGSIGRRGFTADFRSDLYPSIIGSYVVAALLCLLAGLSFCEMFAMIGFATAGILVSAVTSLMLMRCFPPKTIDEWHGQQGAAGNKTAFL